VNEQTLKINLLTSTFRLSNISLAEQHQRQNQRTKTALMVQLDLNKRLVQEASTLVAGDHIKTKHIGDDDDDELVNAMLKIEQRGSSPKKLKQQLFMCVSVYTNLGDNFMFCYHVLSIYFNSSNNTTTGRNFAVLPISNSKLKFL
jgi:hypothetical protein